MRRLIRADVRRILRKKGFIIPAVLILIVSVVRSTLLYLVYEDTYAFVASQLSGGVIVDILFGVLVFFGVYADDFRSMTYVTIIGRGFSRDKIILGKLLDTIFLSVLLYGVRTLLERIVLLLAGFPIQDAPACMTSSEAIAYYGRSFISCYETIGYVLLAAMFLYVTNNVPVGALVLILLYTLVPFSATVFSLFEQTRVWHLERLHFQGLAEDILSCLLYGEPLKAVLLFILCTVIYMGITVAVTILLFEKKELDF